MTHRIYNENDNDKFETFTVRKKHTRISAEITVVSRARHVIALTYKYIYTRYIATITRMSVYDI
jgi:hypothetical protein